MNHHQVSFVNPFYWSEAAPKKWKTLTSRAILWRPQLTGRYPLPF